MSDILKVTCYRHGQSAANAGHATLHPDTIELTELGWSQARGLAQAMREPPDLIVTSPFKRARQSAQPTASRFPVVSNEVWDIGEFTYLCPTRCRNTTAQDRKAWVDAYWARNDADFQSSAESESFSQFMSRVVRCLERLKALDRQQLRNVVMFGHGQFFQALRLAANVGSSALTPATFKAYDTQHWIPNAASVILSIDGDKVFAYE